MGLPKHFSNYEGDWDKVSLGLSLLLFLFDAEGLRKSIIEATRLSIIQGINIGKIVLLKHLLFFYYTLVSPNGLEREAKKLQEFYLNIV